jgi:N-acetylmuramoyl-L-alanine amidase
MIKVLIFVMTAQSAIAEQLTKEQEIVAKTILAEARGEGRAGMYSVACCLKIRAERRNRSLTRVCLQPYQFSCWNVGDPNRNKMDSFLKLPQAKYAILLAKNMGKLNTKFIGRADHYMTVKLWKTNRIKWARGEKPVAFAGNHVFFRLY